jgi:hypothetical protein
MTQTKSIAEICLLSELLTRIETCDVMYLALFINQTVRWPESKVIIVTTHGIDSILMIGQKSFLYKLRAQESFSQWYVWH